MSINKATSNLVKAANTTAKELEGNKKTGVSQLDITSAKKTLSLLQHAKVGTPGQQSALTRAVNRLEHAIEGTKVNPNVRDVPGGGGGGIPAAR